MCAPLATAPRFQWGWYVHTVGFTRSVGFHPRLWSFAPTALFHGATAFQRYRGFLAINHRGGLFVCSSCHRSAVQVWGDMLTGGYVLNGLHPRLLSIRTYGALPGCFAGRTRCIAALESSVGAKEHSRGCNPRNTVNSPHPIEPRSGGQ